MEFTEANELLNIFPHFTHAVERICTPSWRLDKSVYTQHNLILIYDGEAIFSCNGQEYRGSRGDLIYYKPQDLRWAYTIPEHLMKCYAVDFLYTCPVFKGEQWELVNMKLPFDTFEKINDPYLFTRLSELFKDLTKLRLSGKHHHITRCRLVFMEIISLLVRWKNGAGINFDKVRKVEKVIGFMTENYHLQLSLPQLAAVIEVSPSYLGSIFKEITGRSPIDYLIAIRMDKAKELISEGNSVSETALKVGFKDIFYFSKYFKKHEGINPSKYKSMAK